MLSRDVVGVQHRAIPVHVLHPVGIRRSVRKRLGDLRSRALFGSDRGILHVRFAFLVSGRPPLGAGDQGAGRLPG